MYFGMRRSTFISLTLHALIILAAIIALPPAHLDSAPDTDVTWDIVGPSQPQHADQKNKVPAAANTQTTHVAPHAEKQPDKTKPTEAPPPPPPPPPKAPKTPDTVKPPKAAPPPPPPPTISPTVAPTPPPPPTRPSPPQKVATVPQPPLPLPPIPQPPPPNTSPTHQPHIVKVQPHLSQAVLNTLQDIVADQKQVKPPTHVYNPDAGGAPNGGGSPNSPANSQLSQADRDLIGSHVRPCWDIDSGAANVDQLSVTLQVTTDPTGTVREAVVAPEDQDKMTNHVFAAFANRAIDAVMNVQCATLPLPSSMLGQNQTFTFHFSP